MRHISFIISLLILLTAPGCVYDDPVSGQEGQEVANLPFTLTFTFGVPAMDTGAGRTRAIYYGNPLYYEDWIDTQDGLRVLFFISRREKSGVSGEYDDSDPRVAADPKNPLKDYFLFESTSRWVTQLPYDDDNNLRYRVTVPVYQIGNEESEYRDHWAEIRGLLRKYDFKIAILANHPAPPQCFVWTLKNSVLSAANPDDLSKEFDIKTINDIHHSVADANYATNTNGNRKDAYEMLVDNKHKIDGVGTMGPFIDWVTMRSTLYGDALGGTFNSKETARTWIRDRWIPDLTYNEDTDPDIDYKTLYHNYRHVWSYWNFGGAAADNGLPYSYKSAVNPRINDWEVRNGALLREWVSAADANGGTFRNDLTTKSNDENKYDGSMFLTLHPSGAKGVITTGSNDKRFYGVKLPAISAPSSESAVDCFHFMVNATGTVVVRCTGSTPSMRLLTTTVKASTSSKTVNGLKMTEALFDVSVEDEPKDCYLYCASGESTIYDIEVLQDQYLYLTDREGILPSSDHPIPMYGVQRYDRLEGWWDEGASFDLTEGEADYPARIITLLRAVAKIEVLIPKSIGVPKHVYMHSLNRHVRCEPMDVSTPTDELWKEHNNGCEWQMIQAHGTFYDSGYTVDNYKKKLAWYYGNWLEWGWDFNGFTKYIPDSGKDGPFPRIMNPFINRSDCAAFIDVTDYYNDQFYHFLFYMGENTLDASSAYNGNGGSPMIPHIEIRFDERYASTCKVAVNTDVNLMGKDCYRIYFTDGGLAKGARNADGTPKIPYNQYESQYENKPAYLREHWPIIRNHIYRFTVMDTGADLMDGLVVDVQNRSTDFDFK